MKNAGRQSQALFLGNDTFGFLAVVPLGRKGVSVHVAGVDANPLAEEALTFVMRGFSWPTILPRYAAIVANAISGD
jgi:hypothetical protein